MPITINKPITTVENTLYKATTTVMNHEKGEAFVTYGVYDDSDKHLDNILLHYTGADFNTWFTNFNSGTFLDEELKRFLKIDAVLPANNEDYYFNSVEE